MDMDRLASLRRHLQMAASGAMAASLVAARWAKANSARSKGRAANGPWAAAGRDGLTLTADRALSACRRMPAPLL
jgi:hypothetical protein